MNLMHIVLSDIPVINKRKYGAREKVILGKQLLEKYKFKVSSEYRSRTILSFLDSFTLPNQMDHLPHV